MSSLRATYLPIRTAPRVITDTQSGKEPEPSARARYTTCLLRNPAEFEDVPSKQASKSKQAIGWLLEYSVMLV